MTAALSWPLQQAIYYCLSNDASLTALLGADKIVDAPPHADSATGVTAPYVLIGDETIAPWFDKSDGGASHTLTLSVISAEEGYAEAKQVAGLISDALAAAPLVLSRGRVVRLDMTSAVARRRFRGVSRRVDLRLRAVLEDV